MGAPTYIRLHGAEDLGMTTALLAFTCMHNAVLSRISLRTLVALLALNASWHVLLLYQNKCTIELLNHTNILYIEKCFL